MERLSSATTADLFALVLGRRAATRLSGLPTLRSLRASSLSELTGDYGLSETSAAKALALVELTRRVHGERLERGRRFTRSADVYRHAVALGLPDLLVERFHAMLVDGKHRLISDVLVSQGTLTSSPVHPREVFCAAIRAKAAGIVLVHNHPSGDPSPSGDDIEVTRRLRDVGELVGITVLDHVIVGDGAFVSFADRGLL